MPDQRRVDCTHPRARHQHGTRTAYVRDRCRCDDCRAAVAAYERDRKRRILYGRDGNLVDAEPVRRHVAQLSAAGMGWKRVAEAADVACGTIYPILYGKGGTNPAEHRPPRKRVRRDIAERLLAVQLDIAPGTPVPSTGTVRRLQALTATGWSLTRLAPQLGMRPSNLHSLVHGRDQVRASTAAAVKDLYDQLWDQPPPHAEHHDLIAYRRTLRYAERRGWQPPAAWDDEAIDDPDRHPTVELDQDVELDEVAIWRRMQGDRVPLTRAETRETVQRLLDAGMTKNEIERHAGIGWHYLRPDRQEAS